ncbi:DUF1127 domain-containing protein [Epibacterium ulvae]|uniref:YjiS-like domain-containing protein n=1 Tax=Epibacterium ulvae TaxID=1156985 RepID=A0A1G5RIC5_9RHOB|nr:DUF1127 domain-containing protein [Epibacterium ulvae]SCZ73797.1 protein of unknown function [Epibacterium ulvae]
MAYVNTTAATFGPFARLHALVEGFKARLALYKEYSATVSEMMALSERELNDIGISRYDVKEIARKHVYGA